MKLKWLKNLQNLLIISLMLVSSTGVFSQKNAVKDPFLKETYSVNDVSVTDKWIHVLNPEVVTGEIIRVKQYGFADSILYCKAAYKTTSLSNRSCCYITQRMTGLVNKKYRVSFWLNIASKSSFLTSEIMYYNESLASESGTHAGTIILQTNSATTANYLVPDNWTHCNYDIDLTGVTDLRRLQTVRFSFFPNCSNALTQARESHYFISEPTISEISDNQKEYITDSGFDSWDISGWPVKSNCWNVNQSGLDCIKRAPGHRDADFSFSVNTLSDNLGSFIETAAETVKIPSSYMKVCFYARAENPNAEIGVYLKKTGAVQTIKLTDEWKRYEVAVNYNSVNEAFPLNDVLQFQFLKANQYFIDECWMEQTDGQSTEIPTIPVSNFKLYQQPSKIIIDGSAGYLQIFNISGYNLYSLQKNEPGITEVKIHVPGVYFVNLTGITKKTEVQKVIVN